MSTREDLQAAINGATGPLQLEAGVYEIDMPPGVAGHRRPYAALDLGNVALQGVGPDTILRFVGDAGMADWYGIAVTGGRVADLTIDTSALTGTSEQTHAIQIAGPSSGARIERVVFHHPARGTMKGGDGVRLLGYANAIVNDVRISGCTFVCDRSGVAAHSGAHNLTIEDCDFIDVGDQDIDGEGSGSHRDWVIARNRFRLSTTPQGDFAIQLHLIDGARVTDNRFHGRGVFVLSGCRVEFDGNTIIRATAASGVGAIEIDKASAGVHIHHNTIVRMASAGAGFVIRCMPRDTSSPSNVTIDRNTLVQLASGDVINATGVVGLVATRNTVVSGTQLSAANSYGIALQGSPTTRTDSIAVEDNAWLGPLAGCVGINGAYAGAGTLHASGNVAMGPFAGVRAGNVNATTGPVALGDNQWPAPVGLRP